MTAADKTAAPAFTRRQVVETLAFAGPTFEHDWSEKAVIVGRHPALHTPSDVNGDWYVIRFADGGMLSSHASRLRPSNQPAHKGFLPTYRKAVS